MAGQILYRFQVEGVQSPGVLRAVDEADASKVLLMEINWKTRHEQKTGSGEIGTVGPQSTHGWEDLAAAAGGNESFTVASNFYIVLSSDQELQTMQRKLFVMKLIPEPTVTTEVLTSEALKQKQGGVDTGSPALLRWFLVLGVIAFLTIVAVLASRDNSGRTSAPNGRGSGTGIAVSGSTEPSETAVRATAMAFRSGKLAYDQKRYSQAKISFSKACSDGEYLACDYMGYIYDEGFVGHRDLSEAREYYKAACDHGIFVSCARLGVLYQKAGSRVQAKAYYQKACASGVSDACKWRNDLR